MPENSEPAPYTPSLCAHGQISSIKMGPSVSSESQMLFFLFSENEDDSEFCDCEQLGLWALEASFVSLTTEWFPYNMTRKHLPDTSFYGDQKVEYMLGFKNSAFWTLASETFARTETYM